MRYLLFGLIFILWTLFVFLAPDSVYWRDSGEFLLGSFLLDIPHTPGFPTYNVLSNGFTLLPLGPIPWRTHLFSALCATIVMILSYLICKRLSGNKAVVLALLCPAFLLGSSAFLRQALTAEVYMLHAALLLLLAYSYIRYRESKDLRIVLFIAFVSGLTLGNHPSALFPILLGIALILSEFRETKKILIPAIALGLFGFAIYAYIPIRSAALPSMNTGGADTSERVWRFLTNRRDIDLREGGMSGIAGAGQDSWQTYFESFSGDLLRLEQEVALPLAGFALLGLIALFRHDVRVALFLVFLAFSHFIFFKGWQADPWIVALATLGIGLVAFLGYLERYKFNKNIISIIAIGMLLLSVPYTLRSVRHAQILQNFTLPAQAAEERLAILPPKAVALSEQSWFLFRYLQDIEGVREDVTMGYLPQLLFSHYFSPLIFKNNEEEKFSLQSVELASTIKPHLGGVFSLLSWLGSDAMLFIEPVQTINAPFRNIASFLTHGFLSLQKGKDGIVETDSIKSFLKIGEATQALKDPHLREDSYNYFEAVGVGAADALAVKGIFSPAIEILESGCQPLETSSCSAVALNNIGVYLMEQQKFQEAVDLFRLVLKKTKGKRAVVRRNLQTAQSHLFSTTKDTVESQTK